MDAATVPRPRRVWDCLPFLVATAAIVGSEFVAYLVFARTVPPSGDEQFYVVNARAIAAALHDVCHLDTTAARDLPKRLVDLGWFTPGMSFLLVPVAALTDSVPLFRLYVGLLNLGGTLAILWYLSRRSAAAPLIFAAGVLAVPYYSVFAFMLWGDLLAAHLLLLRDRLGDRRMRGFATVVEAQQPRGIGEDHRDSPKPASNSSTRSAIGSPSRNPETGLAEPTRAAIASRMISASERPEAAASTSRARLRSSGR